MEGQINKIENQAQLFKTYSKEEIESVISMLNDELLDYLERVVEYIDYTNDTYDTEQLRKYITEQLQQIPAARKKYKSLNNISFKISNILLVCVLIAFVGEIIKDSENVDMFTVAFVISMALLCTCWGTITALDTMMSFKDTKAFRLTSALDKVNNLEELEIHYHNIEVLINDGKLDLALEYYLDLEKMSVEHLDTQEKCKSFILAPSSKQ